VGNPFERLSLRNVRCFREAEVELDPRVTVLLGENGSGKTTLVEALASLTHGEDEGLAEFPLSRKARSGEIALFDAGQSRPVASWKSGSTKDRRRLPVSRYFFAYGRYRRVFYPEEPGSEPRPSRPEIELDELAKRAPSRRTATLFRPDNHLLRDLSRYLSALHFAGRSDPRFETVWQRLNRSLAELGHGIEGIEIETGRTGYIPKVVRHGVRLELRELSDGYQAILVVIFDLVLRYFFLFPSLEDPLLGDATVAIDEVDLHLHPRWQRTVVGQLVTLFPATQFILTTHSAAVVQGAIDRKRKVVALREEAGAAVARALPAKEMNQLEGAEVGSLLLEERLFGVDSRYSPKYSAVEDRVDRTRGKIERGTASDEDKKGLFADLDTLQKLVAADEGRRADGSYMSQMTALRKAFLEDLAVEVEKLKR
jgi:energy-coupling factor transporter ATP-binding protein EcfA2